MEKKKSVIAIVGPTASGKSALGVSLAKRLDGEIISADSRQVYRGLDIGSGKLPDAEMDGVPHHLIDIADPNDTYTAHDFVSDAARAISDIHARHKIPFVVGGTFFYLALLRGDAAVAPAPPNATLRDKLENFSTEELFALLKEKDARRTTTIDKNNRRRLIRAIEVACALGAAPRSAPAPSPYRWLTIGIDIADDILAKNIRARLKERLEAGLIEEVRALHAQGVSFERLDALGLEYRYIARHLRGELSRAELEEILAIKIRQFAKRQRTWLKRDANIQWFSFPVDETAARRRVEEFLRAP
jgi:tRNA dimethylallyltransferase